MSRRPTVQIEPVRFPDMTLRVPSSGGMWACPRPMCGKPFRQLSVLKRHAASGACVAGSSEEGARTTAEDFALALKHSLDAPPAVQDAPRPEDNERLRRKRKVSKIQATAKPTESTVAHEPAGSSNVPNVLPAKSKGRPRRRHRNEISQAQTAAGPSSSSTSVKDSNPQDAPLVEENERPRRRRKIETSQIQEAAGQTALVHEKTGPSDVGTGVGASEPKPLTPFDRLRLRIAGGMVAQGLDIRFMAHRTHVDADGRSPVLKDTKMHIDLSGVSVIDASQDMAVDSVTDTAAALSKDPERINPETVEAESFSTSVQPSVIPTTTHHAATSRQASATDVIQAPSEATLVRELRSMSVKDEAPESQSSILGFGPAPAPPPPGYPVSPISILSTPSPAPEPTLRYQSLSYFTPPPPGHLPAAPQLATPVPPRSPLPAHVPSGLPPASDSPPLPQSMPVLERSTSTSVSATPASVDTPSAPTPPLRVFARALSVPAPAPPPPHVSSSGPDAQSTASTSTSTPAPSTLNTTPLASSTPVQSSSSISAPTPPAPVPSPAAPPPSSASTPWPTTTPPDLAAFFSTIPPSSPSLPFAALAAILAHFNFTRAGTLDVLALTSEGTTLQRGCPELYDALQGLSGYEYVVEALRMRKRRVEKRRAR